MIQVTTKSTFFFFFFLVNNRNQAPILDQLVTTYSPNFTNLLFITIAASNSPSFPTLINGGCVSNIVGYEPIEPHVLLHKLFRLLYISSLGKTIHQCLKCDPIWLHVSSHQYPLFAMPINQCS